MAEETKDDKSMRRSKTKLRERNILSAIIVMVLTVVVMAVAYTHISRTVEERCYDRIGENVNSITSSITTRLMQDSASLNSLAGIITIETHGDGKYDYENLAGIIDQYDKITPTMDLNLLLPGDMLISGDHFIMDVTGKLSFDEEAQKGEYVSEKMPNVLEDGRMVIRHFVPIREGTKTLGLLYSSTDLADLAESLGDGNAYGGSANIYLIDRDTGDYLVDTSQETLGNVWGIEDIKVKSGDASEELKRKLLGGESGYSIFYSDKAKENLYFYYQPMVSEEEKDGSAFLGNNWTVCVSVPERDAFANVYSTRTTCLVMMGVEFLIMLLFLIWTYRNTNVTLEKAVLEERLVKAENAERAKTMFLSNMSHDIRTPMNAIIGYATLAMNNIDNKERIQDYLSKILASSNHLLSLINDVLDMSRIESGRVDIEEVECSLPDILHDLRNILQSQITANQLNFYIDTIDVIDEDVYCDKLHLNQVLLNLLGNAIKFTPAGGSVSLIFQEKPGAPEGYADYEIRVKDTGIGMSEEFLQHVFEPFERENNTTVSGIQGTGLGMAIAKNIVDMMGGTIEAKSEQGKGTEFILNLELRLQSEQKQVEQVKELQGLHALVVDDDYTICDSVTKMLVQLGLRADWTMSGREAVLHAKHAYELSDEFDAYIIDWQLPDCNGVEIARRIRAEIGENVPIVILTAYDWSTIEEEARKAGVTAFCNKPIFVSSLRDTLLAAIGKAQPAPEPTAVLPAPDESLKGKRILLVEDNELNREIAQEILQESGFVVETAEDGTFAVDMVKNAKPGYYDLILMDVQMPIMNGYEATRAIRKLPDPALANIPIIAMTANAFNEDKREALESGMNDHTSKPIDMEKLFETIRKYL